jgi:LPS-assembly protein
MNHGAWNTRNMNKLFGIFFYMILLAPFFPGPVFSADSPLSEGISGGFSGGLVQPGVPWNISADRIIYYRDTESYMANGDVRITTADRTLQAQRLEYHQATGMAMASGDVTLTAGNDILRGDRIDINLSTGTGTIENGSIFIEKSHFYIRGDRILKTGENSYTVKNARITACDGDVPPWQITGKEVAFTIEKFGTVKHAALWAKKLPVLYVPFLIFPVNIKRQSGLLPPQIGHSSRNGIEYTQPLFWVMGDSVDTTIYYHHLQNRGEKIGAELRYVLSSLSKGTFMVDVLDDRQIDDGIGGTSSDWGYPEDRYLRKNTDRYWFRGKLDQKLPLDITAILDLDIVSDQDYLREFSSGYTGYDSAKKYFEAEFTRDIDDDNDPVRENRLTLSKIGDRYSLNTEVLWYDNVIQRRQSDTNNTLQQMPAVTFDALKQSVFRNRVFIDMNSGFSNFYRRDGLTGQRLDMHPRIYLPLHFDRFFSFEPSAGFRQTLWYVDRPEPVSQAEDEYAYDHRELYDLAADLSTDLFRIFPVPGDETGKMKHTLTPRMEYSYIPDKDQTNYPDFDDTDRIGPENMLTFSITHFLTTRTAQHATDTAAPTPKPGSEPSAYSYHSFLWFKMAQSYDFLDEDADDDAPFQPLSAELNLTPAKRFSLHAETEWDHDQGHFTTFNAYCRIRGGLWDNLPGYLWSGPRDFLMLDYRHIRGISQSVNIEFQTRISRTLTLFGNYERNIEDSEDIEKKNRGPVYRPMLVPGGLHRRCGVRPENRHYDRHERIRGIRQ